MIRQGVGDFRYDHYDLEAWQAKPRPNIEQRRKVALFCKCLSHFSHILYGEMTFFSEKSPLE